MKKQKRKRPGMTVGSSLILVTFVLLCLVAFAALSFVSANADYALSKQTATKTSNYYTAVGNAEQQLAAIDQTLAELSDSFATEESFANAIQHAYETNKTIDTFSDNETLFLSFTMPIDESNGIYVKLQVKHLQECKDGQSNCYEIKEYKTITTMKPDPQTISGDGGFLFDNTDE